MKIVEKVIEKGLKNIITIDDMQLGFKVKLINHDCLPMLMLVNIMLYTMLACLMLFAALSNAVCLHNAFYMPLIFANAFCFHTLSWFIDT